MPQTSPSPLSRGMFLENLYPLALLSGLTGLIFFQALGFDFCVVDDSVYVTENSNVLKGLTYDSVLWALTSLHANFYHPATTLSHMLDVQIYGLTPWGPHLTNILLHTINAYILFLALVKLTGHFRTALLISALFAVHPLHVESVVWISQRKDLLSGLFFFLCLRAYAGYAKNPDLKKYLLVYALFLLALLSKPVVVTLPFVLLLLDFWPLNRLYPLKRVNSAGRQENPFRIFAEKVPFFFAVALFSLLAYVAQDRGGAIGGSTTYPLALRLKNAIVSYVLYIKKTLFPTDLALFYPHPGDTITTAQVTLCILFLVGVSVWVLRVCRKNRAFALGWFWFLGILFPVSGLVQVGSHGMADRYTYLSIIGLFVMLAEGGRRVLSGPSGRRIKTALSVLLVLAFSVLSWKQVRIWQNNETLLLHALSVTDANVMASQALGTLYVRKGDLQNAEKYFSQVLELNPSYEKGLNGLGTVFFKKGELNRAVYEFEKALTLNAQYEEAHNNLANSLSGLKRYDEAISHYLEALKIAPERGETHLNAGKTYSDSGDFKRAVFHLKKACALLAASVDCHLNLGVAYYKTGAPRLAVDEFEFVLKLDPLNSDAHYNLAISYGELGDNERAYSEMKKAMGASNP